ncbi:MAG: ADOP family duplicated permease [Vicinamibacterales bacterium]
MHRVASELVSDVRVAIRSLRAAPGLVAVAVCTFAIGIGANTAITSVVYALLVRPLPYVAPERLVFLDGVLSRPDGSVDFQLQYPEFEAMRTSTQAFREAVPWSTGWGLALEGTDGAERLDANFVGRGYLRALGAHPAIGRDFDAAEHALGGDAMVAILSDATWRQHFGADPEIVGRTVRLQGRPFTVIGVMPSTFHDVPLAQGDTVDVWVPVERAETLFGLSGLGRHTTRQFWGIARLPEGVSLAAASDELAALSRTLAERDPDHRNFSLRAIPLDRSFFADLRRPLWMLLGASWFVVLISAANVANVLLVRMDRRTRTLAVQQALGAPARRLVGAVLAESTVLALVGGVLGIGVALLATPAMLIMSPTPLPPFIRIGVDAVVLGSALTVALAAGACAATAPLWRLRRLSLTAVMADGGGTRATGTGRLGASVAVVELTAAFVLASGAWLMSESLQTLTNTSLSFDHDRLVTARLELPADRYPTPEDRVRFVDQVVAGVGTAPGVERAFVWGPSGIGRATWVTFLLPDTQVAGTDTERLMVSRHSTNPGGLASLGVPLLRGRDFAPTDTAGSPSVAIVSEAVAERLWPGTDAVGRRVHVGSGPNAALATVVGVAADARHRGRFRFAEGATAHEAQLDLYLPYAQRPNALVTLGIRAVGAPERLIPTIRAAIAAVDPVVPAFDIATLTERLRGEEAPVQFMSVLMALYGILALALAASGVFGVLASEASARRRELAIRAVLGASPGRLLQGVAWRTMSIAGSALALGLVCVWALSRTLAGVLFGVAPMNPLAMAGAASTLALAATAAAIAPAWRTTSTDPAVTLREG